MAGRISWSPPHLLALERQGDTAERTTGALPIHASAPILDLRQLHNTNQRQFRLTELNVMSDAGLERQTMSRVSRRLLPFLLVLYVFCYLDRSNVSIAALQMNDELRFSSAVFGLGAGIFFFGYALFELPSNLALARLGARLWIARIMVSWGILAAAMAFVKTPGEFYVV